MVAMVQVVVYQLLSKIANTERANLANGLSIFTVLVVLVEVSYAHTSVALPRAGDPCDERMKDSIRRA